MPTKVSAEEEAMRVAAEAWMRRQWPAARIVHELVLDGGAVRIDLASVGDEELRFLEIKSRKDVLTRLPAQMKAARQCGQETWLLIDEKHMPKLEALMEADRSVSWWSIGLLVWRDGQIVFTRRADNHQPDPRRVVGLLWSNEMRHHLIASNNQANMIRLAVDTHGLRHIMRQVCKALKARPFPRADASVGEASKGSFK